jgi:DNA polymerase-4
MSRTFKDAVRILAPRIEDRGIDEIYIDLSDAPAREGVRALGQSIKDAVRAATGLRCSIGIAANKLLAKIASDLDKPDGLTLIGDGDLERRIWPLPARRINGIGPKSAARLAAMDIHTIADLARAGRQRLVECFGRAHGEWMDAAAHGRDSRPVVTTSEPRSISRETTFERDLSAMRDRARLSAIFTELCEGVGDDLRCKGYAGRTIGLKLRYDNFRTVTRDVTLAAPTQDPTAIRRAAGSCLKRVALERRIRLLGVRVGALVPVDPASMLAAEPAPLTGSLFDFQ